MFYVSVGCFVLVWKIFTKEYYCRYLRRKCHMSSEWHPKSLLLRESEQEPKTRTWTPGVLCDFLLFSFCEFFMEKTCWHFCKIFLIFLNMYAVQIMHIIMDHPGPGALARTAGTGDSSVPYILPSVTLLPPPPFVLSHSVYTTEYTERWPCPLFDILLNKYVPAG
jgi:hypothetical protein